MRASLRYEKSLYYILIGVLLQLCEYLLNLSIRLFLSDDHRHFTAKMDSDVQRPFLSRDDTDDAEERINNRQSFKYVRPVERRCELPAISCDLTKNFSIPEDGKTKYNRSLQICRCWYHCSRQLVCLPSTYRNSKIIHSFDPGNWGTDLVGDWFMAPLYR